MIGNGAPLPPRRPAAGWLLAILLSGCAGNATAPPADAREAVAQVNSGSDLRLAWFGPEAESAEYGFPQLDARLKPIYHGCRQEAGKPAHVKEVIRFAGASTRPATAGGPATFSREVVTEIQCRKDDKLTWVVAIEYGDHRFYQNLSRDERIQLKLQAKYVDASALRERQRTADAIAATPLGPVLSDWEIKQRAEERQRVVAEANARSARHAAEIAAFRAQLKPGSRVFVDEGPHIPDMAILPGGMVVELKPPLALVQFRRRQTDGSGGPSVEQRWIPIDRLNPN